MLLRQCGYRRAQGDAGQHEPARGAPQRAHGAPGGPDGLPARLQDGAGGDRLQAPGIALSIWAFSRLIEVQEPRRARGEAGGGGGLGLLINMVAFRAPSQSRSGSRSPAFASSMIFWATDVVYCGGWAVGAHLRETPPSSREAARGGVRELVEKHGSRRLNNYRHPKFPLAIENGTFRLILRGVVLLGPFSLGFHCGQSSTECSHPCGDSRFLSYSL
jgi:hypothetical protein